MSDCTRKNKTRRTLDSTFMKKLLCACLTSINCAQASTTACSVKLFSSFNPRFYDDYSWSFVASRSLTCVFKQQRIRAKKKKKKRPGGFNRNSKYRRSRHLLFTLNNGGKGPAYSDLRTSAPTNVGVMRKTHKPD